MIKITNYDFAGKGRGWNIQGEPEKLYKALWCDMPNERHFLLSPNTKAKENEKWDENIEELCMIPTYKYPVMVTAEEAKVIYKSTEYVDRVISIVIPEGQSFANIKVPVGVNVLGYRIEKAEDCQHVVMLVKQQCNKPNILKFYVSSGNETTNDYCVLIGSGFEKVRPLDNKITHVNDRIKIRVNRRESKKAAVVKNDAVK